MHEAVYVPVIDEAQTNQMMRNNPDLIQTFQGTTVLGAIVVAQNNYKRGRSPINVAEILAENSE